MPRMGTPGFFPALLPALFVVIGLVALQGAVLHAGAADTLTVDRPLAGSRRPLVSTRGQFALGFFQPGNTGRWYIGIWYNQLPEQVSVWVANRDSPVSSPQSSSLTIAADGNMVILDHSGLVVWSTNLTAITSSTVAVILDTGNLVLAHASNTSNILWQSFDHCGNTWLPGGKLGRGKLSGGCTRLVSWKTSTDPAPGLFSIILDPNGTSQFFLMWNSTQQYQTSGNWTGHSFAGMPEMNPNNGYPNSLYTFDYIDGANESYAVYGVKGGGLITRFVMDVTGVINVVMWSDSAKDWLVTLSKPHAQCDVYSLCGSFSVCTENAFSSCSCLRGFSEQYQGQWSQGDHTQGCRRNIALQGSSNGSRSDKFYTMVDVELPSNAQNIVAATSNRNCEFACLSSHDCTAYSFSGSCSLWYRDLINLQDLNSAATGTKGGSIQIRLAASEFSNNKNTKKLAIIITIATIGVTLIVAASVFLARKRFKQVAHVDGSLIAFRYRDVQNLTKNFSNKLGGGAFGSVFKGLLPEGTLVAVKKLEGFRQGEKQFRAEVSTLGTIRHVNLIRLLGFCSERTRKLLIYEYMPNTSLDRYLFGSSHQPVLSWSTRYQIVLGVARGLHYLHERCRDCIIHCDIKPENILLSDTFVPKVADFGLAKLMGHDFSRVLTTVRGTIGYLAPEWIAGTAITTKADVYSYGMMLFEIISGRRNTIKRQDGTVDFFPLLAAMKVTEGELEGLVDALLDCDVDPAEVERACRVACWCIQDDEGARPSMATIVQALEGLVEVNVPPVPRSLKLLADQTTNVEFYSKLQSE
ncbi:G-type lectin S-receptor-like serine/threonine-protein kinase At2g19130 isoform X1 [Lolium rigidum]|uniref:G-type lectin S-receptor-like serine/threonine-protein kinase At2g19130 isoform X1 n=1 Tax=Lolium rigidum TaxID=89674 RepID=UPI001F5E23CD|nr:G-type lectin S-receptor-like serine/threonine-protein kinase At2g19130 isoform X1 [Lolium rigidum]